MILYLLGILFYVVPGAWVNYTLNKHDNVLPNMPFTAKEFGLNLLKEKNLKPPERKFWGFFLNLNPFFMF